jgi:autotransporter-associated beta strand protein
VATKFNIGTGTNTAEFDLNGRNQEIAGLSLVSGSTAANNAVTNSSLTPSTLTVNTAAGSPSTFVGLLKGNLALAKTGTDSLTLSGASSYTGATSVNNGTLVVNGNISTSTSLTVASGATLGGSGTVGPATISGILAPGNGIGTLTANGDVTWNASGGNAWLFELGSASADLGTANLGSNNDLLRIAATGGDFLKGSGSAFTFDFANSGSAGYYKLVDWDGSSTFSATDFMASNLASGLSGDFIMDPSTSALYLNVIPEPSTALLGALGMLALLRRRRD